ncbi:hypothetical protein BFX35_14260 [Vibrio cholerae]|nr:hypothetical protein BFX35_14260 [Vibrio cholerae]
MALTKGQPMAVQICSRQICHSLAAYLQLQVVWVSLNESCRPLLLIRIGEGLCISKLFNDIFPHTVALPSWF